MITDPDIRQYAITLALAGERPVEIARETGVTGSTVRQWLSDAGVRTLVPNVEGRDQAVALAQQGLTAKEIADRIGANYVTVRGWINAAGISTAAQGHRAQAAKVVAPATGNLHASIFRSLLVAPMRDEEIAAKFRLPPEHVEPVMEQLRENGRNVGRVNGWWLATKEPAQPEPGKHVYTSRPGGYYKFGLISDNHYCSKHCREDVVEELYDFFAAEQVDRVFNCGNYIDGEARFNKHEIFQFGIGNQMQYFVSKYPRRPGIKTYIVSGDDHEGWYGQREGIDIGRFMESRARDAGRDDLVNIGHVESHIKLQRSDNEHAWTYLAAVHPGGGSAYAISYAAQKYVEALQGGEKPAVVLFGHWHKIFDLLIRNVICLGAGCTKDLDMFGRKNKLAYHLGGMVVELWQDERGAITDWRVRKKQFFDRGYYNNQWTYEGSGLVVPEAA